MLEAIALSKNYNGRTALQSFNLKVEPGEVFCLMGAKGAGKTTTINCFLGFVLPSSGEACIDGLDVQEHPLETKSISPTFPNR